MRCIIFYCIVASTHMQTQYDFGLEATDNIVRRTSVSWSLSSHASPQHTYRKCSFLMTFHVRLLVCRLVGRSVRRAVKIFLKGLEGALFHHQSSIHGIHWCIILSFRHRRVVLRAWPDWPAAAGGQQLGHTGQADRQAGPDQPQIHRHRRLSCPGLGIKSFDIFWNFCTVGVHIWSCLINNRHVMIRFTMYVELFLLWRCGSISITDLISLTPAFPPLQIDQSHHQHYPCQPVFLTWF